MSGGNFVNQMDDLVGNPLTEATNAGAQEYEMEVSVVDDRPDEDQVAPRNPNHSFDVETDRDKIGGRAGKRISQLKYEYHEERRHKEAAEKMREEAVRYAQEISNQNNQLRQVLAQGENVLLGEMKERAKSELDKARTDYKAAYEEGNTDNLLKAQEDLNRLQREVETADSGTTIPHHLQGTAPAPPQDPRLSEWMGRNSWFGRDEEMTSFAYGIHQKLVQGGVDPQSDDYYQRIDNRLREVFPGRFGNGVAPGEPVANSRTTTVVGSATRSSLGPRKVQLTSTQVALAKRLGLTNEQYAQQVLKEMG